MTQAILNKNGFATIAGNLTVYSYDRESGEYSGEIDAYISLGTGIPGNTTLNAPPVAETGFVYCWDGKEWNKTENHRGETVYNTENGQSLEIKTLGPIPESYTQVAPPALKQPGETLHFDGTAWQIVPPSIQQQALLKYQQGISQCANMAPQGKTPSEAVQTYYQQLYEIAYPAPKASNAHVMLAAMPDTKSETDPAPAQTLPQPPADLGNPNDPNSGWWV